MASITSTGASWNRDWVAGEHGGESFKTSDAIVDVVNPQQIKVEKVFIGGSRGFEDQDAVTTKIASLPKGSVVLVSPTHGATAAVRNALAQSTRQDPGGVFSEVYLVRYMTPAELVAAKAAAAVESEDDLLVSVMGLIPGPWSGPGSL
jgi:hypothetical protein